MAKNIKPQTSQVLYDVEATIRGTLYKSFSYMVFMDLKHIVPVYKTACYEDNINITLIPDLPKIKPKITIDLL